MDFKEIQEEEIQVLASIYEGDENFKEISCSCFQYKCIDNIVGVDRAFITEISWPPNYPEEIPNINLDIFFNKNVPIELKSEIKDGLTEQAEQLRGEPMTYTLFEWVRENSSSFLQKIPDFCQSQPESEKVTENVNGDIVTKPKKEKKEQLTKAQKRKLADQFGGKGEQERGWNWVDVVKHLSQTGSQRQKES